MNDLPEIDVAICASWIIPIVPRGRVFEDCAILIKGERIEGIVPSADLEAKYAIREIHRLPGQALLPGLVNAHGHAAMSLLRGYADDLPLETWLNEHIWPAEKQWLSEEFVKDGTQLAMGEMLLAGTTCFADMYFFPEATAKAAFDAGMRTQLNFPILDFPNNWSQSVDESLERGLAIHDAYRSHHLISVGFGPHAPYTVSDGPLMRIAVYAEEMQSSIQIHLHETAEEIQNSLSQFGMRPIERLADLGFLSPLTQCVHMTQVTESDIDILKQSGAHVIHCPSSNLKLACGISPVAELTAAGVNVALGTDGAASNHGMSVFAEMKLASLLAKVQANSADSLVAVKALEMATINGAKALGLEQDIGSLEAGKFADICAVDLSQLNHVPLYNPFSQLVYADCTAYVKHVWVAGKHLVDDRKLRTLDEVELIRRAKAWQTRIGRA